MGPIEQILAFTVPAVVVAAAGAGLAAWKPPGKHTTSMVQHLAAGIVFAAAALELLPQERAAKALPVALGFGAGLLLMLAIRAISGAIERRQQARTFPYGLILVTAIDLAIDGLVLGAAFASGETAGVLVALALILEVLFVSLSIATSVLQANAPRLQAVLIPPGLTLLLCAFSVIGRATVASLSTFWLTAVLGIGTVALLYLVTEELLVEAHEVEESAWTVSAFFLGFLAFLLLEMAVEA